MFWRAVYRLLDSRAAVAMTSVALGMMRAVFGEMRALGLAAAFERRYVISGWPTHGYGWINLHASRFLVRVRRRLSGGAPLTAQRAPRVRPARMRVGCFGPFHGLLSFTRELFEAFPAGVDLHLFDVAYAGRAAAYLAPTAASYAAFDSAAPDFAQRAARAITDADLDLIVNCSYKSDPTVLDRIDTPCIANFCGGSDLLHHDKVGLQFHGQPQADYFVVGGQMFCGTTRAPFGRPIVAPLAGYYDRRDLPIAATRRWTDREPLIVFHGSLYKLAHRPMLECVLGLLRNDSALTFVFMGRDTNDALRRIEAAATAAGVQSRAVYEGHFSWVRDEQGGFRSEGWTRLRSHLERARLAPDPWPVGGASSRFEVYALGAPGVHMGVRFDQASWGRPQPGTVEVPHLLVAEATAWSPAEYRRLCERSLYEEGYATQVIDEQLRIARRLSDPRRLWVELFDGYAAWLRQHGREAEALAAQQLAAAHTAPEPVSHR